MPDNISNSGDTLLDYGLDEQGKKQVSLQAFNIESSHGIRSFSVLYSQNWLLDSILEAHFQAKTI